MNARKLYRIEEAARDCGLEVTVIVSFIEREWLRLEPGPGSEAHGIFLDEEDLARARLIRDLTENLGVNEEAVPIILSLIDQLHCLRAEARRRTEDS